MIRRKTNFLLDKRFLRKQVFSLSYNKHSETQGYFAFPRILNIFVPQTVQMPVIALRSPPFPGMVTSLASFISRFWRHFTQYPSFIIYRVYRFKLSYANVAYAQRSTTLLLLKILLTTSSAAISSIKMSSTGK